MKKRILVLLMSVMVMFSLSACNDADKDTDVNNADSSDNSEGRFDNVSGTSFDSSVLGLSAEFDEDWILYNNHEILEVNGYSADDVVNEEDIKVGDTLTELTAYDYGSYDCVILYSEKIEKGTELDINSIAEEKKAELEDYYASVDYTNIVAEVSSRDFLDEERTCINISAELEGDKVYFTIVYVVKDSYLLTFDVTASDEAGAETILSDFKLK